MRVHSILAMVLLTMVVLTTQSMAQKGGKGKGGGDDTSDPPVLPNVKYEVDVVAVNGLNRLEGVNDMGQCVGLAHSSLANATIQTVEDKAAILVNTVTTSVSYLDNLIDPAEPWDLYSAQYINNRGQIIGIGVKNGLYIARAYLLNPRTDGSGYDLVDLGVDGTTSRVFGLSESGDVLLQIDDMFMVRTDSGALKVLPSANQRYFGINSLGMLAGDYTIPQNNLLEYEGFYSDFDGNASSLESLPYMTRIGDVTLSESGYSFGGQWGPYRKVKGREYGGSKEVTYDPMGNATELSLPFNINGHYGINAQVVDGVPLIAGSVGSGSSSDIFARPWIRFPGYDAAVINDLMDDTQKQQFENLGIYERESNSDFKMSTPRDETGAVLHTGAPSLYGEAFVQEVPPTINSDVYLGIYVIRPVETP